MSSSAAVSTVEAMAALAEQRDTVDLLQARYTLDVRRLLRPLGFSPDPAEWHGATLKVLTSVNREYRHDARIEIVENARKIRRKEGFDKLAIGLLNAVQAYEAASQKYQHFQDVLNAKKSQLSAAELHEYEDILTTFKNTMSAFESQVSFSRESMNAYKPVFRLLDRPPEQIRAFTNALRVSKPQIQNTIAVKALLARLLQLHERRRELEEHSGALFLAASTLFMETKPLTSEVVEVQLSRFAAVRQALEEQGPEQAGIAATLQKFFDRASSPLTLTGTISGMQFSIADLRDAYNMFTRIYNAIDIIHEMSEPLTAALDRATIQLTARAAFNIRLFTSSNAVSNVR